MKTKLWLLVKAFAIVALLTVLLFFTPADRFTLWLYIISAFFIIISFLIDLYELKKKND